MKIGILTQPLHNNYGGLLQAYALQKVVKKEFNATPVTLNIQMEGTTSYRFKEFLKRCIKRILFRKKNVLLIPNKPSQEQKNIISEYTDKFIDNHLSVTKKIFRNSKIDSSLSGFDAYIVGSDQVWRPKYSPNIYTYFLDFLIKKNVTKISYAASFGVDFWEYSRKETLKCAQLAQAFTDISVREDAAVMLCKEHLGVKVTQVLDPTLLLNPCDFDEIINDFNTFKEEDFIMFYVLDPALLNGDLVSELKKRFNVKFYSIMPESFNKNKSKDIDKCKYPPVGDWLCGFKNANYIITDSFHGTAFSILYNKPFITLGNKERGLSRFNSILNIFNLEDRLVTNIGQIENGILDKKIDYRLVNEILEIERGKSFYFLEKNLTK